MNKKERKWLKSQVEKEKIESARRIPDLTRAIEELVSGRKKPQELEGIIAEAKALAQQWKGPFSAKRLKDRRPLFDGASSNVNFLLAALVVALRRDHELLEPIRRRFPDELDNLSSAVWHAELRELGEALASTRPKPTSRQAFERKRRKWHRKFYNSIEYQFGGAAEAERRKALYPFHSLLYELTSLDDILVWERRKPLSALHGLPYEPTCLDDIFAGVAVNMQRLEDLFFGIDRHRLSELVSERNRIKRGREVRYDYRAVAEIMGNLLKEPRKKGKRSTLGRPPRAPWLNDNERRRHVLSGIEARINSFPVREDIKDAFLKVVQSSAGFG